MVTTLAVAFVSAPRPAAAALSLALSRHDYPKGVKISALPATNTEADLYFGPVHRSPFDRLGRIDGEGWIQAALYYFRTGRGRAVRDHRTIFGYGIHVFKGSKGSLRALRDIKLRTQPRRVAHLWTRYYRFSGVKSTLVFDFFRNGPVEIEAYYEYKGVAPATLQKALGHKFSTQTSHLVALSRRYSKALRAHPTVAPTSTALPTDTPTPVPVDTPTSVPTALASETVAPTATLTPTLGAKPTSTTAPLPTSPPTATATPSPTPTLAGFVIAAAPAQSTFAVGDLAPILVHVTLNGSPVFNALASVNYFFPGSRESCASHTDASGEATCSVPLPALESGTPVSVQVEVSTPSGDSAITTTSFTVR